MHNNIAICICNSNIIEVPVKPKHSSTFDIVRLFREGNAQVVSVERAECITRLGCDKTRNVCLLRDTSVSCREDVMYYY